MKTTSGSNAPISSEQFRTPPKYRQFTPALLLLTGVAIMVLMALVPFTQDVFARSTSKGETPGATSATMVTGARGATGMPTSPDCGPNWAVVSSPNPGTSGGNLKGVSAVSSSDVWAVGDYSNGFPDQTVTEHWNGSSWSLASSPNVGTYGNYLKGVIAISGSDVWAVGYYYNGTVNRTLTEHWNGSTWSVVSSPNIGTYGNYLYGVAAAAGSDVWAVGYDDATTVIEHWNGSAWSVASSPNPGCSNYLYGVAAKSANDVWAVGGYTPSAGLSQTLVEHWNGSTWSVVASPSPCASDNSLAGVVAVSSSDVWAVGSCSEDAVFGTLIEQWNGSAWSVVSDTYGDGSLAGVVSVSSSDVWAVGYSSGLAPQTIVKHWNGSAWSVVSSPNPSTGSNTLSCLAAVSSSDVWAVGSYAGTGLSQTLVARYNPCPGACSLQFEDVPTPSTFYAYVQCLACRGIINGYACGGSGEPCNPTHDPYFRPNANVSRGQIAKIVALAANIQTPVSGQTFEDMPPGSTFYTYTEQLYALGVMNGYACGAVGDPCNPPANRPYFRPNAYASRGQIAKIDSNTAGYQDPPVGRNFEDVSVGSTFYTYTQRLTGRGVMSGYSCGGVGEACVPPGNLPYFRPNAYVTRGQTSKIVANTFFPNCQTPSRP